MVRAGRTRLRFASANASFRAVGESGLAAAAEEELRALAQAAVAAVLRDARPDGSGESRHAAINETAVLERISELAAALPARRPQPRTPVSQVKAGDVIGHPGYKLQPFRVTAPPCERGGDMEITGHLTAPAEGEPAGHTTLAIPTAGHQEAVVSLIPLPQRSLRPLFPAPTAGGGTAPAATAPASPANSSQPTEDPSPTEEKTVPSVPAEPPGELEVTPNVLDATPAC